MNKQTIWIIQKIFFRVKQMVFLFFVIRLLYILYDSYFYKHTITIAVGTKTGAYATYGKTYKKELEKYPNVRVKIKITEGSIKAQEAVLKGEADFAFAQEGTENFKLTALANVAYEPIWIFVKKDSNITSFSDLNGKIVNIGSKNTGTYPVSLDFLQLIDFNLSMTKTLPSKQGYKQLKEGKIDAMIYTVGINSQLLNNILNDPTITFLDFKEAESYRKNLLGKQFLYPKIESKYYHILHIKVNSLNLKKKIPSKDVTLLAKRTLLLTKDAPDEVIRAVLKVADLLHSKVGILHKEKEFPNTSMLRISENKVAKRYFEQPINTYESNRYIRNFWLAQDLQAITDMILTFIVVIVVIGFYVEVIIPITIMIGRLDINRWYKLINKLDTNMETFSLDELKNKIKELEIILVEMQNSDNIHPIHLEAFYSIQQQINDMLIEFKKRIKVMMEKEIIC
ncbi:MAG: hypothetical protein DSZ11_03955 [Sulfurovum sp.]|nr:MAG: hypothetical protein DSZ11_03955 [Sulfurovum sp.]